MKLNSDVRCSHCNSSEMEYYGFIIGGLHYYFMCQQCHNFTEYRLSIKNMLIIYSLVLAAMIFILGVALLLLDTNPSMSFLFFLASVIFYSVIAYKYRWQGFEKIALSHLPDDIWILRSPKEMATNRNNSIYCCCINLCRNYCFQYCTTMKKPNEALHWIGVKLPTPPSELGRSVNQNRGSADI